MDNESLLDNSRHTRLSAFDRPATVRQPMKSEYDNPKSAWNNTSNIWRTNTAGTDGTEDDNMTRIATTRENSNSGSSFKALEPRTNNVRPTVPWSFSASNSTSARHTPAISTSEQRQNGFFSSGSMQQLDNSSLLFDSAPDVDGLDGLDESNFHGNHKHVNASRFQPQHLFYDSNDENLPHQAQFKHANLDRFNSKTILPSTNFAVGQTNGSTAETRTQNNLSATNGYHNGGRSISSSGTMPKTSKDRTGNGFQSFRHRPFSNASSNEIVGYKNDATRKKDHSEAYVDDTTEAMANFGFGGTVHKHTTFPEPYPQLLRPAYNNQNPSTRHGRTAQTKYNDDNIHTNSVQETMSSTILQSDLQYGTQYQGHMHFIDQDSHSAFGGHRSSLQSPYYSATATPPTGPDSLRSAPDSGISSRTSHHDTALLERKLRSLEPHQRSGSYSSFPSQHVDYAANHEAQMLPSSLRMNPLAVPYNMTYNNPPSYLQPSRPSFRELENSSIVRSPLLEDFRLNSKTNKKYELRDIYNHIVEFSGDQHGSRFIQQKLETANSDEKDQVFSEIQPNCLQLMTDVFGNYVIQKMFEHGNQSQKKVLANNMKGHVLNLSLQMYGCRVVQKALEHVLTDQQASMVKELDGPNKQILKVIRDQNGNHVVQKAIERVPAEYIQFIVEAHRGEVVKLATHTYGCRVIQRILEHCQPAAKRVILDELHGCIQPLITDSFGNYVVQHVIQNGEYDDRRRVVAIVQHNLLIFSKHKFASNVVEKCIEYADDDQRKEMLARLIGPNDQGQTPVLGLLRDQYGNYVIQRVFAIAKGEQLEALIAEMKACFPQLKRTSYGRQVTAVEKLLYGNNTPSSIPSNSSRTSEPSSTNASSTTDDVVVSSNGLTNNSFAFQNTYAYGMHPHH